MKQCRTDCIHAEACRRYADNSTYWQNGDCPIYKPTADVVPKSEVEEIVRQWKEEANCWQNNYITEIRANEQIKAEIAREIFEEIDSNFYYDDVGDYVIDHMDYQELKKKYTESEE